MLTSRIGDERKGWWAESPGPYRLLKYTARSRAPRPRVIRKKGTSPRGNQSAGRKGNFDGQTAAHYK